MRQQRVEVTQDKSYYPQFKWMFWWFYYKQKSYVSLSNGIWKQERRVKVQFMNEEGAISFLDDKHKQRTSKKVTFWITWKPKE